MSRDNYDPVVYDTENTSANLNSALDSNASNASYASYASNASNTGAEHRPLTPESEFNYFSIANRNKTLGRSHNKEVESLRTIIDRLDNSHTNVPHQNVQHQNVQHQNVQQPGVPYTNPYTAMGMNTNTNINTYGAHAQQTKSRNSVGTDPAIQSMPKDDILTTMRVDMISIIKLLQTLHSNIGEQTSDIDNIKEDIYNVVLAMDQIKSRIDETNNSAFKRHQKSMTKVDNQIRELSSRLDALEKRGNADNYSVDARSNKSKTVHAVHAVQTTQSVKAVRSNDTASLASHASQAKTAQTSKTSKTSQKTSQKTSLKTVPQTPLKTVPKTAQTNQTPKTLLKTEPQTETKTVAKPVPKVSQVRQTGPKPVPKPVTKASQEIYDNQSVGRSNIRVVPKKSVTGRDSVGNQAVQVSKVSSRSAMRVGKFEDTVEKNNLKVTKLAKRGMKDSMVQIKKRSLKDVIKSEKAAESVSNGDAGTDANNADANDANTVESVESVDAVDSAESVESVETDEDEENDNDNDNENENENDTESDTTSVSRGRNIKIFKA